MGPFGAVLLEGRDPLPFGPSSWGWPQWLGAAGIFAVFLVAVVLVGRFARPRHDSEGPPPGGD